MGKIIQFESGTNAAPPTAVASVFSSISEKTFLILDILNGLRQDVLIIEDSLGIDCGRGLRNISNASNFVSEGVVDILDELRQMLEDEATWPKKIEDKILEKGRL